jgi:hypothetical protein
VTVPEDSVMTVTAVDCEDGAAGAGAASFELDGAGCA